MTNLAAIKETLFVNKFANSITNKILGNKITIFTLHRLTGQHGLTGISLNLVEEIVEKLKLNGAKFVNIDEAMAARETLTNSDNLVSLTIDDGYLDQASDLVPMLLDKGVKPTLFVVTNLVENAELPWDAHIASALNQIDFETNEVQHLGISGVTKINSETKRSVRHKISDHAKRLNANERQLFLVNFDDVMNKLGVKTTHSGFEPSTWSQLRQLESEGLLVGSHSVTHQPLSTLTVDELQYELEHSLETTQKNLSSPSKIFCYPVGLEEDIHPDSERFLKLAGYKGAVTATPGHLNKTTSAFKVPRIGLPMSVPLTLRYTSWFEKLR